MIPTTNMIAPSPGQTFSGNPSGTTYMADANSLVANVQAIDVVSLIDGGCQFQSSSLPVALASVGLSASQSDLAVFQRATVSGSLYGLGRGAVPVTVTLNLPALAIDYRLRDAVASGHPVLQDWAPGAYAVPAGASTIKLSAVPARLGWYYIDLRVNGDNSQIVLGTARIGMGRVIAAAGQSLCTRMFGRMDSQSATNASLGVTISPYGSVYATYYDGQRAVNTASWALPADGSNYDSTFAAEFLRREITAASVTCALIGAPVSATAISTWQPGQANNTNLLAVLAAAGGSWETFIWMQGHSDSGAGTSGATYQAALTSLFNTITGANAFGSTYTKLIATIPNIDSASWGTGAAIQIIRTAALAWCAANGGVYVNPMDLALIDGVHESQSGAVTLAQHFYRATRPQLAFAAASNDNGPTITAASRAQGSAVVKLTIALNQGTALTAVGSPYKRFQAFNSGTATALTVSNATIISVTEIDLTLSATPADSQAVDVYFCYPPDYSYTGGVDMIAVRQGFRDVQVLDGRDRM